MKTKPLKIVVAFVVFLIILWALINLIDSFQNVDRDGDGLNDKREEVLGTAVLNQDSDWDDLPDGQEYDYWQNRSQSEDNEALAPDGDIDGDNIINIMDEDSDNDGISDGQELDDGTDPADCDTDNDGLNENEESYMGTDPTNPDSDGDGILDGSDEQPGTSEGTDDLSYGPAEEGAGGDPTNDGSGGASSTVTPHRNGYGGMVTCYAVFDPALINSKRYVAYDAITENYTAYISDPTLYPLEQSDIVYSNSFVGIITLDQLTDEPIPIPSVSPNANILSAYFSEKWLNAQFYKDGADNYYIASAESNWYGETTLTFMTSADSSYFNFNVPEYLALDDIPSSVKRNLPSAVVSKATLIIDEIGLTGETNLKKIVDTLYNYFSSFTEGAIPSEKEEPDIYLAIARAKHGACYIRSFACFITANAIGLPTRLVVNECHAFVEMYIPDNGWERLDLGGLGGCRICNPDGYRPFANYTQPEKNETQPTDKNETRPSAERIPTTTTITEVSPNVYKTERYFVEGYVKDTEEKGVNSIPIEIYVLESKEVEGSWNDFLAGRGVTDDNGQFVIICSVPDAVPVGINQVVAQSLGNKNYSGSRSDPVIEIYSNTTIQLDIPQSIGLGDNLLIQGTLQDDGNQTIEGKTINIYYNDSSIGQITTNDKGKFLYEYTPPLLGTYNIVATFDGGKYLGASEANRQVTIKDLSTDLTLNVSPTATKRGGQITLQGILSSDATGFLNSSPVHIYYDHIKTKETTTSTQGYFEETFNIPSNSTLGNVTIHAHYPGTNTYAEANAEQIIHVKAETKLTLLNPTAAYIERNQTLLISGTLMDNIGQPISNVSIQLEWTLNDGLLNTNSMGNFNVTYALPDNATLGFISITATFPGDQYYLSSQDTAQIEIVPSGYSPSTSSSQNTYILLGIVIAIIIGMTVGIIMLFKKRKVEEKPTIEEIATQTINRLRTEKDHRRTVINCYKQMCNWLEQRGVKKDSYQTPREFALATRGHLKISPDNLYDLTQIFEKARYSKHEISIEDRSKAIKSLSEILTAPVADIEENNIQREDTND